MNSSPKGCDEVILGQFRIERVILRTAVLYQVRELRPPHRSFMAKRIRPEHTHRQDVLDWFSREQHIARQVSAHPHIVRFLEPLRTDTDGVNYGFFEFMEAGALADIARTQPRGRLAYAQTLRWAAQVASAMEFASKRERNRHGMFVHRDLDASNVLVSAAGHAKVGDWGLGKDLLEPEDRISLRSIDEIEGRAAGKSPCMPPEQFPPLRGADYGVAGDVYYLGGLIVQMLAGLPVNPPEESRRLQLTARTFEEVAACLGAHHEREILPRLADCSSRRGLVDLVAECILVDPLRRLADFTVVRRRLDELAREVRAGLVDANGVATCVRCGFIGAEGAGGCPVCKATASFAPWDPSSFHLGVLDEGCSAGDEESRIPPAPRASGRTSAPALPPPNELVPLPAGAALIGAKEGVLLPLAEKYGLAGARLAQFSRPRQRSVHLPAYSVSRYAVSNAEYAEFVRATGWRRPSHWANHAEPPGELPVVNVSFADAEAFCQWKGVRLPDNDQWERAARGAAGHAYPWGDEWQPPHRCNSLEFHQETERQTVPVTEFAAFASPDGLVNMAGNVWEWVDGGEGRLKHTRGGSWRYQGDLFALAWFRLPTDPGILQDDVGFRFARAQQEPPLSPEESGALQTVSAGSFPLGASAREVAELAREYGLSARDAEKLAGNATHTARLAAFRIRRYPVTNEEYFRFTRAARYPLPSHWQPSLLSWLDRPFLDKYRYHPVTRVAYRDAAAYCAWAGGRLPTADEWEAAARGSDGRRYPWGAEFDAALCNTAETGLARTTRVDRFPRGASPCGCFDMTGNVCEWVAPGEDGSYGVRGGSFEDRGGLHGLSFLHLHASPDAVSDAVGFRCVLP